MSLSLKLTVSGLCCATAGGGLIGSNYIFKTEKLVDIPQDNADDKWKNKLPILLQKITETQNLTSKIETISSGQTSKLTTTTLSQGTGKKFTDESGAKDVLKAWCKKERKDAEEQKHINDLCKESINSGWLFGNSL